MKNLIRFILVMLLLASVASQGAEPAVISVAVFDFESKDENVKDLGAKVSVLINVNLSAEPHLMLVERTELEKVLGEQELGLSGTVTANSAAKVGQLTGAKVLVTGRVFKLDQDTVVVAKVFSAETSRVFGETVKAPNANVADLAAGLAQKIAKIIKEKSDALVAVTISREEKVNTLVKSLPPGKRSSIKIRIPEQHFGTPVIDPAAETELSLIFQKAGFTLVDDQSGTKPDLEISGEAFSALGMRKGNLISCKARVEIKVRDLRGQKLLLAERQHSVAVDLAEQTAAKLALQQAALELAGRLLPALCK
jgi:hypothetical protein